MSKKNENRLGKADLVDLVAKETGLTKKDVTAVVESLGKNTVEAVKEGKEVAYQNIVVFKQAHRKATTRHNPKNPAEKINVPAKTVVTAKVSKSFTI